MFFIGGAFHQTVPLAFALDDMYMSSMMARNITKIIDQIFLHKNVNEPST